MKNREKQKNIGQTRKDGDSRRKTHEKKFRSREGSKKKERHFVFQKMTTEKIELFWARKKAETEMKKKGKEEARKQRDQEQKREKKNELKQKEDTQKR